MVANGQTKQFVLPDKPHELTVSEGGTPKTVGIKNIDKPEDYDYMLNYQEKYVETNGTAPTNGTVMEFTYKYDVPILVAVEDKASIDAIGAFEFAIFDTKIKTVERARERAQAELTDYADAIISGSFSTMTDGFRAGQYININLSDIGINADYFIKSVTAQALGAGTFRYQVSIVSSQTIGMIRFLISMLDHERDALNIDPNEVVDELFEVGPDNVTISEGTLTLTSFEPPYLWDNFYWGFAEWS